MTPEHAAGINEDVLALAVEKKIRPLLDQGAFADPGNEGYHHAKVLPSAQPCLTEEAIRLDPTGSLVKAVQSSSNLLSTQEKIWTKQLATHCDDDDCRRYLLDLLYGAGELADRIKTFHDWAHVRPVPGTEFRQGCTSTVVSYLLAMTDPKKYAFCKPTVYKAAVTALLGRSAVVRDKLKRVVHAAEFYTQALRLLRDVHGLPFDDLLYVHSAFFRLVPKNNPDSANWDNLSDDVKPPVLPPVVIAVVPKTEPIAADEIGQLLLTRKNVILYGPPGTGKTYRAQALARTWRKCQGDSAVEQVTFHPSYAYEDFIEGFRPVDGGGFDIRDGIFTRLCHKARDAQERQFLLVIDEINRGDVARLFGELITLIEADKRGREFARRLPYSQRDFWVPPNLHLLGTMNTADRSISLMDIAIRRRFSFVEFAPDPEVLAAGGPYLREVGDIPLSDLMLGINSRLVDAGVDRDRAIGHSYFLIAATAESPLDTLCARLRYDVFPLIEEYCYADRSLIRRILGDLVTEHGEFDAELLDDENGLLAILAKLAEVE